MTKVLCVVVRQDLEPGLQLAQAVHAASELALRWRTALEVWDAGPAPTVVVLGARDEAHLQELYAKLVAIEARGSLAFARAIFHEPDLGGQASAFGCFADERARRLFSSLPKALKGLGAFLHGGSCMLDPKAVERRLGAA